VTFADPFQGDVKSLQCVDWTGMLRKRLGDYRLISLADHKKNIVFVLRILRRSGKTYR
jgi:mRNA-degrading endonuclease RelE of RelBE toxin-antitoxin system